MAYGASLYGATQYATDPAGANGDSQSYTPDLLQYLPEYYHREGTMKTLLDSTAVEIGTLLYGVEDILNQFFVHTATWGLSLWEQELGMTVDPSKPDVRRREQIIAKLRGFGTVTKQMIINTATAFSGGEVDVIEYPAEYRFVIKFIGVLGIPPNMAGFVDMLNQIKPAHLTYSFNYTYTTWDMLEGLIWQDAGAMTWSQLRTYGGGA